MEALKSVLGGKGKKVNHDTQVLHIEIPTAIVMKYLPDMLNDLKELNTDG